MELFWSGSFSFTTELVFPLLDPWQTDSITCKSCDCDCCLVSMCNIFLMSWEPGGVMCVLVSGLVSMQRRHIIHHLISGWREGCLFSNSRTYNRTAILKRGPGLCLGLMLNASLRAKILWGRHFCLPCPTEPLEWLHALIYGRWHITLTSQERLSNRKHIWYRGIVVDHGDKYLIPSNLRPPCNWPGALKKMLNRKTSRMSHYPVEKNEA